MSLIRTLQTIFLNNGIEKDAIIFKQYIDKNNSSTTDKQKIILNFMDKVIIDNDCLNELSQFCQQYNCFIKTETAKDFSLLLDNREVDDETLMRLTPHKAQSFSILGYNNRDDLYYPAEAESISIHSKNQSGVKLSPIFDQNKGWHFDIKHFKVDAYTVDNKSTYPDNCHTFILSNKEQAENIELTFKSIKELTLNDISLKNLTVDSPLDTLNLEKVFIKNASLKEINHAIILNSNSEQPLELSLTETLRINNFDKNISFKGNIKTLQLMDINVKNDSTEHIKTFMANNTGLFARELTYFVDPLQVVDKDGYIKVLSDMNTTKIHFLDQLKEIKKVMVKPAPDGTFKRRILT